MGSFLLTFYYFIVAIIVVVIGLLVFELLTRKYKDWDEIKNGNHAVALSIGGKIIGICIILSFSVYHSVKLTDTIVWGAFGVLLQMLAYLIFEVLTRKFSVEEQLQKGNIAVGIIAFSVSVGLAFVIGASIT
jgi:putative membrane protein